jgi:hypothetical protein
MATGRVGPIRTGRARIHAGSRRTASGLEQVRCDAKIASVAVSPQARDRKPEPFVGIIKRWVPSAAA